MQAVVIEDIGITNVSAVDREDIYVKDKSVVVIQNIMQHFGAVVVVANHGLEYPVLLHLYYHFNMCCTYIALQKRLVCHL